jgi:hypothetical protein
MKRSGTSGRCETKSLPRTLVLTILEEQSPNPTLPEYANGQTPAAARCYTHLLMARSRQQKPEDTVDTILERINVMREELLSLERSLERFQAAASADIASRKNPSSKKPRSSR